MSVAVIPMAADLGWSPSDRGLVNSAFFWGYSATQIPAGWVSTRCVCGSGLECASLIICLTSVPVPRNVMLLA